MKLIFKTLGLSVALFFVSGCFGPTQAVVNPDPVLSAAEIEQIRKDRIERDPDRDDVISRTTSRHSNDDFCEDLERRSSARDKCEEACDKIYKRDSTGRRECKELKVGAIEELKELYELLEEGDEDALSSIEPSLFDEYVNVSIGGLEELVKDYSNSEAEDFLVWLLTDDDIAEILKKEDDDFVILDAIFKELGPSDYSPNNLGTVKRLYREKLDGDEFIELVVDASDEVFEWFLFRYFEEKNQACKDDKESRGCFEIYCHIGDILGSDSDDLLRNEDFEDYIEDIIDAKTNATSNGGKYRWNSSKIDELDDLDDHWVKELCGRLTG